MTYKGITIFWFRRDLRIDDNIGLFEALKSNDHVQPVFIFDDYILDKLPKDDPRLTFIYDALENINFELKLMNSSVLVRRGRPIDIFRELHHDITIKSVYTNEDYDPYPIQRDKEIENFFSKASIPFYTLKDTVIFAKYDILKQDKSPYHVFTAYKNKWLNEFENINFSVNDLTDVSSHFHHSHFPFPSMGNLGIIENRLMECFPKVDEHIIRRYDQTRDYPFETSTTQLGPHIRFGTISIRNLAKIASSLNSTFLNELIWREFFKTLIYFYPYTVKSSFDSRYRNFQWNDDDDAFERWTNGETGYAFVDAGMRELNETGFMHNRARMITASFLTRHLLIDWKKGERYFSQKLMDYDLSANIGNWQWAAGVGCDAVPYFRIFNPEIQQKRFDPDKLYIKKWVPEYDKPEYQKIIDHRFARERAIETYKRHLDHARNN